MDVNIAVVSGVLVREPRSFKVGESTVASASLKVESYYNGKAFPTYVPIKVWNDKIRDLNAVKPGERLTVYGEIKTESYEKDGKKVYSTFITVSKIQSAVETQQATRPKENGQDLNNYDLPF